MPSDLIKNGMLSSGPRMVRGWRVSLPNESVTQFLAEYCTVSQLTYDMYNTILYRDPSPNKLCGWQEAIRRSLRADGTLILQLRLVDDGTSLWNGRSWWLQDAMSETMHRTLAHSLRD